MVTVLFSIVWERKVVAWMQLRIGPNRHGPWGMLQSLADGIKLMLKEDLVVKRADKVVYVLAPIIAAIPAFMAIAVIPFGPADNEVSIFGHRTTMQLTDLPIAMLYILAVASVGIYGIVLAGWSSGSTYPLLGGLRSCAQMISLRDRDGRRLRLGVPLLGLDVDLEDRRAAGRTAGTSCCCRSPSSSTSSRWSARPTAPRSTCRSPRATWSAASTPSTRRSSSRCSCSPSTSTWSPSRRWPPRSSWAAGGPPGPISTFWEGANHGWWPMLWFVVKVQLLLFFFIWLRGTPARVSATTS